MRPRTLLALPLSLSLLATALRAETEAEPAAGEEAPLPGHSHIGDSFDEGPRQAARKMDGVGDVHLPISTAWSRGQAFFDQGLGQLHGFWYYEAERTFRQIAAEDPGCAMAYWGMAMANWENSRRAKGFIDEAVARKDEATPHERMYIEAQAAFLGDEPKDIKERRKKLILALEDIIHEHPDDLEAKAFLAVRLWQFDRQGVPIASRQAVDSLLDQVFAANPLHPAHHYRVHLWDGKKTERALGSAAVLHATAPTIAHMWHMPGHTYDKLKRYPESAYHQEASARVDHRTQAENGVLPDAIHNYAHNNEWLTRNWGICGRADDSVAMAKALIDNPMHPKLNHFNKGNSSAAHGRKRLLEALGRFERWGELVALADTHYLPPTDVPRLQTDRLLWLGRAHYELGQRPELEAAIADLASRRAAAEEEKAGKEDEAREKAEAEGKDDKERDKLVREAGKALDNRLKEIGGAADELAVYITLLDGTQLDAESAKKIKRGKDALALIHLRHGDPEEARKLAAEAVDSAVGQTVPLAVKAHVLETLGDAEGAAEAMAALRAIATAELDIDAAPFARLAPVAARLGHGEDWRDAAKGWRGDDFGAGKPEDLSHLGPLRYQPPTAPSYQLTAEDGSPAGSETFAGRPVVLMFYLGHSCGHCVEQLNAFAPLADRYAEAGIALAAISPEPREELVAVHEFCDGPVEEGVEKHFPFPLYSDPSYTAFKAFRAFDDFEGQPLHGTFLIDAEGKLRWLDVGYEPFMDGEFLLEECERLLGMRG